MTTSLALEARAIRLDQIAGVSDLNPRLADENEIAELAASIFAVGQLQDLMVEPAELKGHYLILDGQRRWRAMHHLVESGSWPPDAPINVTVVDYGDEALRREKALAANTMRRALHPVDEYEAFAELAAAGVAEERIAKDFGLDVRRVRQRLALGRLSSKIRAAWRTGKISADIAQAYTAGATHEAQDAVFDAMGAAQSIYAIKSSLRADSLREDAAEAAYIGVDAYLAAGGRIEEQLFDDGATWLDGALAKRLAREKLTVEAEAIAAAEGWGFVVYFGERGEGYFVDEDHELEFTAAENKRLDEIDALPYGTNEELTQRKNEIAAIELKALLRQIPHVERASLGIVADLFPSGTPCFNRAWREERKAGVEVEEPTNSTRGRAACAGKGAAAVSSPAVAPTEKTPKALREVLDAALDGAFAACIVTRPDLALMLAVAKFGPTYAGGAGDCIKLSGGLSPHAGEHVSELLGKLSDKEFDKALAICADAPAADLASAFCEIVARSISVSNRPHEDTPISKCEPIARALASRGAPLADHLDAALDREAYFAAASKKACLGVADEIGTPAINSADKKALIASYVAADAAKKHWLPPPLSDWAALTATSPEAPRPAVDERPLAQAMLEAIDADEQARRDKIMRVCDFQGGSPLFAEFLIKQVEAKDGAECKASDLRAAYLATTSPTATARPLSAPEIGAMLKDLGVASKRKKDGVYYLGLGLKDEAA